MPCRDVREIHREIDRYAGQQLQYLGGSVEDNSQISPETRQVIDGEVQRLVTEQYERAQALLKDHHSALKTLARQLLKQETVSGSVVKEALKNILSSGSAADGAHMEQLRQEVGC